MKYDFIEIGTCDYDTLLESATPEQRGISVEPIKLYLDRLPSKANVIKINAAITAEDGIVDLFWVEPHNQHAHGLEFTKGWGTIITPHHWHTEADMMLRTGMLSKHSIEALSWKTLCVRYSVSSVDYVKIDTEGHDCVIVQSILSSEIHPLKIRFEKSHCKEEEIIETTTALLAAGYVLKEDGEDMVWEHDT